MRDISENDTQAIEQVNSIKEEVNSIIQKCRHLVGSFKHNEGLVQRLKEKQIALNYETKIKLTQLNSRNF